MINIVTISELQENFGKLTEKLRKQNGLSQTELAKDLNLSRSTIQKVEKGENITMTTFLMILQNFELKGKYTTFLNALIEDQELPKLY